MTRPRYGWALVAVLWFIWLLNYLDRQVLVLYRKRADGTSLGSGRDAARRAFDTAT